MKLHRSRKPISLFLAFAMVASLLVSIPFSASAANVTGSDDDYNGSQLWMNYTLIQDTAKRTAYQAAVQSILVENYDANPTFRHSRPTGTDGAMEVWEPVRPADAQETLASSTLEAAKAELERALPVLLGVSVPSSDDAGDLAAGAVVVGTPDSSDIINGLNLGAALADVGDEGYLIKSATIDGKAITVIAANTDIGALYGTFAFLRLVQTLAPVTGLNISESPKVAHRRLNNWDTERLYASVAANGEAENNGSSSDGGDGSFFIFKSNNRNVGGQTVPGRYVDELLPMILDRYIIFARACASVGINEININNVNAHFDYLGETFILMEAALADALRPYGVKIGVSVKYTSPSTATCNTQADIDAGGPAIIPSSEVDANNPRAAIFRDWWTQKAIQIKTRIPDFIGFTIKANSEGQPGPQTYGYDHGDGADGMGIALAAAVEALQENQGGVYDVYADALEYLTDMTLFWRTFVYDASVDSDRLKRAYMEFDYINDGFEIVNGVKTDTERKLGDHVFIQTKNGPLDFQGREPINPMFGRMDNINQAIEVQITKEYTGHHIQLCYLAPMWEEVYKTDTGYTSLTTGESATVGEILDGTAQGHVDTAFVGVSNIGNAENMTGHDFDQANFFAYGRQAWDWTLDSEDIAEDWVRMTWGNDPEVVETIVAMMMGSWEALVSYTTPLGVGHQMTGTGTHYFPNPAHYAGQDDWSPIYYNRISGTGMGFNRTDHKEMTSYGNLMGSNFAGQFSPTLRALYNDIDKTPENLLMWFHHVPWDFEMDSGRAFWDELVYLTQMGVQYVTWMNDAWASLEGKIDEARYEDVALRLWRHEIDASEWRDLYYGFWQANSQMDMPVDDGALSISLTLGTGSKQKTYQGFDLAVDAFNKNAVGNLNATTDNLNITDRVGNVIGGDRATEYLKLGTVANAAGAPFNNYFTPVDRSYQVRVPAGVDASALSISFLNTDNTAESTNHQYEIISQSADGAVVRVSADSFFGPIVKYYNFEFVTDSALSAITVNRRGLKAFDPDVHEYTVLVPAGMKSTPKIIATASDSAASVTIDQATGVPGEATITVTNAGESTVYTISFLRDASATDDFSGDALDSKWSWVRENDANWELSDGALTISTETGDLQAVRNNQGVLQSDTNDAKNILLQAEPDGDWMIETKVAFSALNATNQQAGLIVYGDDNNYIKVALEFVTQPNAINSTNLRFVGAYEANQTFTELDYSRIDIRPAFDEAEYVWFRITRENGTYKLYAALDDSTQFRHLGTYTPAAPLADAKVGLLAMNRAGTASIDASFDYFAVTSLGQVAQAIPVSDDTTGGTSDPVQSGITTTQTINEDGTIDVKILKDGTAITGSLESPVMVTVSALGPNYVAVIVNADGTETPIIFSKVVNGEMRVMMSRPATIAVREVKTAFVDMVGHWSLTDTNFVVGRGLFVGTSETTYSPEATVTLATLPQVLYRMAGMPALGANDKYPGIEAGMWYSDAMNWFGGNVMSDALGEDITKLSPDGEVSTEVLMTMLYSYAQKAGLIPAGAQFEAPEGKFGDAKVSDYAKDAMDWAVDTGLLIGNEHGIVIPGATVTRAVLTTIIARFIAQQITG